MCVPGVGWLPWVVSLTGALILPHTAQDDPDCDFGP